MNLTVPLRKKPWYLCRFWRPFALWALLTVPLMAWIIQQRLESSSGASGLGPGDHALTRDGNAARFAKANVTFDGQHAIITGEVATEDDRLDAESIVRQSVKAPHWTTLGLAQQANPVRSITNHLKVERIGTLSPGWLSLAVRGREARLRGDVPDETAAAALRKSVKTAFPEHTITDTLHVSPDQAAAITPAGLNITTKGLGPSLSARSTLADAEPLLRRATLGGSWRVENFGPPLTEITALAALAVPPGSPGQVEVAQDIRWLREASAPALPLGWAALALQQGKIRLTGDAPDAACRLAIEKEALTLIPGTAVENLIRINPNVTSCDLIDLPPTMKPLLTREQATIIRTGQGTNDLKLFASGMLGRNWTQIPWELDERSLTTALRRSIGEAPGRLDTATHEVKLLKDQPTIDRSAQPSGWVTIAATGSRLVIVGNVPDAAGKSTVLKNIQRLFPKHTITDALTLDDSLAIIAPGEPLPDPAPLTPFGRKLPLQPADTARGLLASCSLAGPWETLDFRDRDASLQASIMKSIKGTAREMPLIWPHVKMLREKAPTPPKDDAFISLIIANKKLMLLGELPDEAARTAALAVAKERWPNHELIDALEVMPSQIRPVADWAPIWKSLKAVEDTPGSMVAQARPNAALRTAVLHSIYFASGQSGWSRDQDRALTIIRRVRAIWPTAQFEITGHTDNKGKREDNLTLSSRRAEEFAAWLRARQIASPALSSRGAGPDEPAAENTTEKGRALNRRVDLGLKF